MIDESFAKKQVARMGGLDNFPRVKEAIHELVSALMCSRTEQIAYSTVDDILGFATSDSRNCPLPADIRRMAYAKNEEAHQKPVERAAHCPKCQDSGIIESIWGGPFDSIASWCQCPAAEWRWSLAFDSRVTESDPRFWPDNVNLSRRKLQSIYPNWRKVDPITAALRPKVGRPMDEIYHGEF